MKDQADMVASKYPSVTPVFLDIQERPETLESLIQGTDVVVSLLPYSMHPTVAKACIANKVYFFRNNYYYSRI